MNRASLPVLLLAGVLIGRNGLGCIWDSDTLADEKSKSPTLAKAILGESSALTNTEALRTRIATLQNNRQENDPAWWNELAGAHIRLGNPKAAAELLEPVVARFPDDYGIHANLGTAYHLLGRYAEAEREIARDLEINPDAHFGLEKYHLALLQYLMQDHNCQSRHVYVDEFTLSLLQYHPPFFTLSPMIDLPRIGDTNKLTSQKADLEAQYATLVQLTQSVDRTAQDILMELIALDSPPEYCKKWNLAENPNLEKGVIYMAELNQQQPACFVMLGVIAARNQDLNLAIAAFERAVKLGSPQANILNRKIVLLRGHISKARPLGVGPAATIWVWLAISAVVSAGAILLLRSVRRSSHRATGN